MAQVREQIMIISNDQSFGHLLKVTLDLSFDYELLSFKTSDEAHKKLSAYASSLLALIYYSNEQDFTFSDILQWIHKNAPTIKVIVITDNSSDRKKFENFNFITSIDRSIFTKEFNQVFKVLFGFQASPDSEYKKIDIASLARIDGLESDAYVKLGTDKYVKLMTKGDRISNEEIERFRIQNITHIYIPNKVIERIKKQISTQANFFINHPGFKFVVRGPTDSLAKKFEQKIIRCNEDFLIDEEFQKQLEGVISKTMESLTKISNIDNLLKTMEAKRNTKENYLAEHMILLAYITSAWSIHMGWHSQGTREKLIIASILHDITLAGHPHLAKIKDLNEFKTMQLSKNESELFLKHPLETAHLVSSFFKNAPHDTEVIIRQHHELPDGKGFPQKISWSKITPLSALFIVAHEYVYLILTQENMSTMKIIAHLQDKYPHSIYHNIIRALVSLLSKKNRE